MKVDIKVTGIRAELLPCPFCGKQMDAEDGDTLYPNGMAWERSGKRKQYTYGITGIKPEQWCFVVACHQHNGGCGAEINADSAKEAIERWNTRYEAK